MLDEERGGNRFDQPAAAQPDTGSSAAHVGHMTQGHERGRGHGRAHDERDQHDWRAVDRALRACARRRAALDAEEARWLVAAEQLAIHRRLGCGSIHEYMERVLGYGPRVARERLRVARALADLPAMTAALATGALSHSAVRELTRVATPATEGAWIEAARGLCLREIEQVVSGRERGDLPDDPDDAEPRPMTIELEVSQSTMALYRQALRRLGDDIGEPLTDDHALALMSRLVLDGDRGDRHAGEPAGDNDGEPAGDNDGHVSDGDADEPAGSGERIDARAGIAAGDNRPPYQIAITVCDSCKRGWHDAAGRAFALPAVETERAWCDAHVLGRVDGVAPARVTRTIPPAIRRQVFRRDRGRCLVPGCRASRFLEVHHVIPRAVGGTHDPRFLAVACSAHHAAIHAGLIEVTGQAPAFVIRRVGPLVGSVELAHVGRRFSSRPAGAESGSAPPAWDAAMVGDAAAALRQAGFTHAEATRAVREATAQPRTANTGTTAPPTLASLVVAALRALRPRAS